ncbi:DUF1592 domain-containing protein [Stieleria varia]|uniref:Planctomycete cytochrome C n=1 Tax=Stieleria varia TaxID=2528005 RepID=A0A5C6B3Q5_9BACT|nr:DUF1592 domain-containing protein [Stieleria varia]TWU06172.1 Planctomycete cytochrome C [Stieleria varia]
MICKPHLLLLISLLCVATSAICADEFEREIRPVLGQYCIGCHSTKQTEGELDLEQFASADAAARSPQVWQHVLEQLDNGEMPPKEERQLPAEVKTRLSASIQGMLDRWALASAGDPGDVVLRRLSNVEYAYTLRDLTEIESLDPAKEFPTDGAAGEGFTNSGAALVMSPSLLTKYLDAAKDVADHAVLLPTGIRFSPSTSRRDWTSESLTRIRDFYRQFTIEADQKVSVNGTGVVSNDGGRIPLEQYLAALDQNRTALVEGEITIAAVAHNHSVNAKYLGLLWTMLQDQTPSLLLDSLRSKWRNGELTIADIQPWQDALWRFTNVGHLGKVGGPKAWMEPVSPLVSEQEFRVKLESPDDGRDVLLYLSASNAGDGNDQDFALWENGRIVADGRPDLLLKDLRGRLHFLFQRRDAIAKTTTQCLAAAHEAQFSSEPIDLATLATKHAVDPDLLAGWLTHLGINLGENATRVLKFDNLLSDKTNRVANYEFIKGWSGAEAYSVLANSSDATVQIPGTMKPHSVATHPSPTLSSIIGWRCPESGKVTITGSVQDAHTACGNGVTWAIEVRRGNTRETLAAGVTSGSEVIDVGRLERIPVRVGDMIALVIGPGQGSHVCDLTAIELTIQNGEKKWDLAADIVPDILAGNPHADQFGNREVWYFFGEPESPAVTSPLPAQSLLARWRRSLNAEQRSQIAQQLQQLLQRDVASIPADSPDRTTHAQLLSFTGPLLASSLQAPTVTNDSDPDFLYGIEPTLFGKHPNGSDDVLPNSLCVQAPTVLQVRLPASLVDGAEFVVQGRLHPSSGEAGSVQLQVRQATAEPNKVPDGDADISDLPIDGLLPDSAILVNEGSVARQRIESALNDFRRLFPAAVCYTTIVPVDEVVTLTLFHREDEPLSRLMLNDEQRAILDRLWAELHFVSQDALTLVDAFQQIWEYSTQDGPNAPQGDKRLEPLREPIERGADEFRKLLIDKEPVQVAAAVRFADRAWRRPLTESEQQSLHDLYQSLRTKGVAHEQAVRLLLTRVLTSPEFLYRSESVPQGSTSKPVDDWALATRLSYFLWSSTPDDELRAMAAAGKLRDDKILIDQARRMLRDDKVRRLATEFGCQWLHIRDLETLNEKSERHFPTFVDLRDEMQEEAVRFLTDLFQADRSVLSLLDADHSFMNAALARHYDIELQSDDWQRVDGLGALGRGGMLGFAATLSKQSGASRTSPILRGNWISEVVLGEKLPRPPKDVPVLPDEAPAGLTERQLIERHSSDPGCARCHQRIDHFGFALEGFDAIGRARSEDAAGLPIDTLAKLPGGSEINGLEGLRSYLIEQRRDDFLRQFCRKLLGFALGRGVQLSDKPLLDDMITELQSNEFRVSTAIEKIILSPQFRQIRGREFVSSNPPESSVQR